MSEKQRTLKGVVKMNGIGLHTGLNVNIEIHPATDNHGYKFQRIDLDGKPTINADVDLVVSTERGTTLEQNNAKIHTVEHVLASLYGCQVDNALICVDGPEIPIMDGSALKFVEAIEKIGYVDQSAERKYFELTGFGSMKLSDLKLNAKSSALAASTDFVQPVDNINTE